jgi:MFS family permease
MLFGKKHAASSLQSDLVYYFRVYDFCPIFFFYLISFLKRHNDYQSPTKKLKLISRLCYTRCKGETAMTLTQKRWIILGSSCFINLCIGSIYSWSIFASPMAAHISAVTGAAVSSLAIVFTVANSVAPITMISGGGINDKLGPKWVIRGGAILFGSGMVISGFAQSKEMLIAAYGLGVGLGNGMIYGCNVSNSVKFFPDRRGFAGGITTAFFGISSIIMPPIASTLIHHMGVTTTFKVLGCAMTVIILCASFFVKECPRDFKPDGWSPAVKDTAEISSVEKNWKGIIRDPLFYIMLLLLLCGAFSGLMIISQASPIAQRMVGMSVSAATAAVSILALFNTMGRIAAGFFSDKFGSIKTITAVFIVSIVGLLLLYFSSQGTHIRFYAALICIGISFGSIMGVFPGLTAEQFGSKNNSVNYGIMFIGFAASGYFGPTAMSAIYAKTESYQPAFLVATGLALIGIVFTARFYKMKSQWQITE